MRPLPSDFWGCLPRQLLAGLTLLLAAAVLSVVLFPAGHGSFVSTHGPATAFRSRRLLLAGVAILLAAVGGTWQVAQLQQQIAGYAWARLCPGDLPGVFPSSAVLQC